MDDEKERVDINNVGKDDKATRYKKNSLENSSSDGDGDGDGGSQPECTYPVLVVVGLLTQLLTPRFGSPWRVLKAW